MSDTTSDAAQDDKPSGPSLGFAQQYVKDLSFESPQAPKIFMAQLAQPDVNVDFNVSSSHVEKDIHEVILEIEIKATANDEVMFIAELSYGALVQITGAEDDVKKRILMIEAPRHLFPFARAILAEAIRDGGFPPLLLNPIDFQGFFQQNQENA
ncbi:MAG: protein-export chaperone SecB [Alphaproteobacteria bacterium]|nr:protein-export chaperone SecB [Alphaproteobacteria bacterium]